MKSCIVFVILFVLTALVILLTPVPGPITDRNYDIRSEKL